MTAAEMVPKGTLDLHVHTAPDIVARAVDDMELARVCVARGWSGAALKSHTEPTGGRAAIVAAQSGASMVGGIVLNGAVGGLNAAAVDAFARATPDTARIVWMPTKDAAHDISIKGTDRRAVPVIPDGKPAAGLEDVLRVIARRDLVLASGHLHPDETLALFAMARGAGVGRLLVTHATAPITDMPEETLRACLDLGAHVELCARNLFGRQGDRQRIDPAKCARAADVFRHTPGRVVLSSDLGDPRYPLPWDGLARAAEALAGNGVATTDLNRALVETPARLVHHATA